MAPDLFAILTAIDERQLDAAGVLAHLAERYAIEAEAGAPIEVISGRLAELTALGLADAVE